MLSKGLRLGERSEAVFEQVGKEVALLDVERHNPERVVRSRQDVLDGGVYDALRLDLIHLILVDAVCDVVVEDAERPALLVRRREDDQLSVVELLVRERDQRMVLRAIMPAELPRGMKLRHADVEDAFGIRDGDAVGRCGHAGEERGRGELFGVAHDHQLLAPGDGTDGLGGRQLRGLVHDDDVERHGAGLQKLGDGLRAHHEAGHQLLDGAARSFENLPDRHSWLLLREEVLQQPHFGFLIHAGAFGAGQRDGSADARVGDVLAAELNDLLVEGGELPARRVVPVGAELRERVG